MSIQVEINLATDYNNSLCSYKDYEKTLKNINFMGLDILFLKNHIFIIFVL